MGMHAQKADNVIRPTLFLALRFNEGDAGNLFFLYIGAK